MLVRSLSTSSRPALRAAASGGRPRAGGDAAATGEPTSPTRQGVPQTVAHCWSCHRPCSLADSTDVRPPPDPQVAIRGMDDLSPVEAARHFCGLVLTSVCAVFVVNQHLEPCI